MKRKRRGDPQGADALLVQLEAMAAEGFDGRGNANSGNVVPQGNLDDDGEQND